MAASQSSSLTRWQRRAARRMVDVRRATLRVIAGLPQDELYRPRTQDRWSVKDVLAHLMSCDEETAKRLDLIARGRAERILWFESMAYADRFNARTVARARPLGLPALLRRMARARARLLQTFDGLPATALRDPSHKYPVVEWLPAPGWTHEQDHVSDIKRWWRSRRGMCAGQNAGRRGSVARAAPRGRTRRG